MTTPYDPTENAIDAAIQREIDTPDRYQPRGEWNWKEWRREDPTPETVLLCAILSDATRQFERGLWKRTENMLLYGQAERPTDMSEVYEVPDRYPTTRQATCEVCGWKYSQTNGVPETCPACERNARMVELNRVCNVNSDLKGK